MLGAEIKAQGLDSRTPPGILNYIVAVNCLGCGASQADFVLANEAGDLTDWNMKVDRYQEATHLREEMLRDHADPNTLIVPDGWNCDN